MPDEAPLAGRGVLVTRPAQQAERLARALERRGARVLRFPLVHIAPPSDPNAAQAGLASLEDDADLVVFLSANAVRLAFTILPDLAGRLGNATIACVGDATAAALAALGVVADVVPERGSSSEALLALDEFQDSAVRGRDVAVVKGEGGRDLLARTLAARGARVRALDVYRREPPQGDLAAFVDGHAGQIDAAVLTSAESVERLADLAGIERVGQWPLVLPSARVRQRARELGFVGPVELPARMNDTGLADAAVRLLGGG